MYYFIIYILILLILILLKTFIFHIFDQILLFLKKQPGFGFYLEN